jgi:hypothetical protein
VIASGYRNADKFTEGAAMLAIESLRAEVKDLSARYTRLRAATVDYVNALPSDAEAALRKLRHELERPIGVQEM